MTGTRRSALPAGLALAALVAVGLLAPPADPSSSPSPSAGASPSPADPLRIPFSDRFEPFAYAEAPPLEPTPLDGFYVRVVSLEELGGPVAGVPTHCRRCVPFELDPGLETLTLYRGRYFLDHQLTARRALGHYEVAGDEVRFLNDPNCSRITGEYTWAVRGRTLVFEPARDPCPFGADEDAVDHRARDLSFSAWTRITACSAQIRTWWPALFGCGPQGSRSS